MSRVVSLLVQSALEQVAPQLAEPAGVLSGLLAALAAGVGTGWLLRAIWEKLEKSQSVYENIKAC